MIAIAAVDSHWGIGNKGNLLFRNPADMKFFKEATTGNVVVMGMNTLKSFKGMKPLPNRLNIVLTKKDIIVEGCVVKHSVCEVLDKLKEYPSEKIFIIGGGQVYKQFLPYCDKAFITKIYRKFEADTFFPDLDADPCWEVANQSEMMSHEGTDFMFVTYENLAFFNKGMII